MRLSLPYLAILAGPAAVLSTALVGCSTGEVVPVEQPAPPGKPGPNATLEFEHEGTLALAPGEEVSVTVLTSPPDHYEVSFLLLGESRDASLDHTTLVADEDGRATVNLRAPGSATTFTLRATIKDGPSKDVAVSVSDEGFGTVHVIPSYAGAREVTTWTASVVAQATCEEIAPTLPDDPDGALTKSAPFGQNLDVELAPVGPNLAVVVRAGRKMWGCADEADLVAGAVTEVKVTVIDKPLDLSTADLDLTFEYAPAPGPYGTLLDDGITLLVDTMFPAGTTEATTLLDAMALLAADPLDGEALDAARGSSTIDDDTDLYLSGGGEPLADLVRTWAVVGLSAEPQSITGLLRPGNPANASAFFSLDRFGSVTAKAAGVPADHLVSWTAQPGDVVLLGASLYWLPTRYIGAVALAPATTEYPAATTVPEALAERVDCPGLAAVVGPFGSCDEACAALLCESALTQRWALAVGASASTGSFGTLDVAASGLAEVSDDATPISFAGTWVGSVASGTSTVSVSGAASGVLTRDEPQ